MEWNTKWDWENLDIFSPKSVAIGSPKKLQSATDWGINEKEDIDGSFNLSGVVNVENNSSGKSSFSASTESSFKDCMKVSNVSFEGSRGFHEANGTSPSLEASVCSSDQSIGLKLGKRTYFENSNTKTSSSPNVPVSVSTVKKAKLSHQNSPIPRCQVEGCNLELSSAKEYHRKHRVCDNHSKSLKVVVGGLERRFCQQCSRFHGLSEFDGKKRSCRRRLSDHNARRRKPQQETIQFNSRSLSSSFYDGEQQLSFVFNNVPLVQPKPAVSSAWENVCNSQHQVATVKAEKYEDRDGLTRSLGFQFPNPVSMPTIAFNRIMPSKGTTAGVLYQGSNAEDLDIRRALSLLSNNSWGSHESDLSAIDHHPMHTIVGQHGLPFPSPECWQFDQQSVDPHIHPTSNFQEYHILKPPYGIQYANPMDES